MYSNENQLIYSNLKYYTINLHNMQNTTNPDHLKDSYKPRNAHRNKNAQNLNYLEQNKLGRKPINEFYLSFMRKFQQMLKGKVTINLLNQSHHTSQVVSAKSSTSFPGLSTKLSAYHKHLLLSHQNNSQ